MKDLHKNRFKNGWFTLLRFTNEVNKKAKHLEDLKAWTEENRIEKPEWVQPVIIFDKEKHEEKQPRRRRNSGVRKMNLVIGIDDEDGKEKKKEQREQAPQVKELP